MAMASPVRGLRPSRAARSRVVKVPKPVMAMASFLASASPIVVKKADSTASAVDLETEAVCGDLRA